MKKLTFTICISFLVACLIILSIILLDVVDAFAWDLGMPEKYFCPVCQEKGLTSRVYYIYSTRTLMGWETYWDEEGNYHSEDPNYTTSYFYCSLGHEWYEVDYGIGKTSLIQITKDTENEEYDVDDYTIDIGEEPEFWFTKPEEESLEEDEYIAFGDEDLVVITIRPTVSMTFGDNIGKISWETGIMTFEGDADESAEIFFEECLKPMIDNYIKYGEKEEPNNTSPIVRIVVYQGVWCKPTSFLEIINTDVSEMIKDDRMKLIINNEIYWIRLEKDEDE